MIPLHFGKIAGGLAVLTAIAFVLWLMFGSLLTGEVADQQVSTPPATQSQPAQ
jgi:hypothetical protein